MRNAFVLSLTHPQAVSCRMMKAKEKSILLMYPSMLSRKNGERASEREEKLGNLREKQKRKKEFSHSIFSIARELTDKSR